MIVKKYAILGIYVARDPFIRWACFIFYFTAAGASQFMVLKEAFGQASPHVPPFVAFVTVVVNEASTLIGVLFLISFIVVGAILAGRIISFKDACVEVLSAWWPMSIASAVIYFVILGGHGEGNVLSYISLGAPLHVMRGLQVWANNATDLHAIQNIAAAFSAILLVFGISSKSQLSFWRSLIIMATFAVFVESLLYIGTRL